MTQDNDELSLDCGGDCWGCVGEIEAAMGDEDSLAKVRDESFRGLRPGWIDQLNPPPREDVHVSPMIDYDKYLAGLDVAALPEGAREVLIALGQCQYGEYVDQRCVFCRGAITVEPLTLTGESRPTSWRHSCPCGKCNGTMRGL
ncbi:hypothetical protein [Variovorax fucosicus]|uniref:hypothetical protein n=1 Tax=Variovorax fucosicus TaxID=3053517 RepID=UPI002577225E|nr:hypothetical protein [Variovorax sp. J22G47]MDM0059003.1 hypothetical protein [Variovorax sp. J22G47]